METPDQHNLRSDFKRAVAAAQVHDFTTARLILREVLKENPRSVEAWMLLAQVAAKAEQTVYCLERVLQLDPGNLTARRKLAQIRWQEAHPTLQDTLPTSVAAHIEPEVVIEPEPPSSAFLVDDLQAEQASPTAQAEITPVIEGIGNAGSAFLVSEAEIAGLRAPFERQTQIAIPAASDQSPLTEQASNQPVSRPTTSPLPKVKPSEPAGLPAARGKARRSNLEGILLGVLILIIVCFLGVVGFSLLGGVSFMNQLFAAEPTPVDEFYFTAINENIRAANREDVGGYMATIHHQSPLYAQTEELIKTAFQDYDLSYAVSGLSILERSRNEVKVTYILTTRKISGPAFRDNVVEGLMILRQDGEVWKIYNQTVDKIEYLD
jgi:hypothetical protein